MGRSSCFAVCLAFLGGVCYHQRKLALLFWKNRAGEMGSKNADVQAAAREWDAAL